MLATSSSRPALNRSQLIAANVTCSARSYPTDKYNDLRQATFLCDQSRYRDLFPHPPLPRFQNAYSSKHHPSHSRSFIQGTIIVVHRSHTAGRATNLFQMLVLLICYRVQWKESRTRLVSRHTALELKINWFANWPTLLPGQRVCQYAKETDL